MTDCSEIRHLGLLWDKRITKIMTIEDKYVYSIHVESLNNMCLIILSHSSVNLKHVSQVTQTIFNLTPSGHRNQRENGTPGKVQHMSCQDKPH